MSAIGEVGFELFPDGNDNHLARGHFAFEEWHVEVEVAVVHFGKDVLLDDVAHELEIDAIAGVGLRLAFHCYKQIVIMAVPVGVGAFAECLQVRLLIPLRVPQLVRCVKALATGNVNSFHASIMLVKDRFALQTTSIS